MWSRQIFVTFLCTLLACQQVAAVVNSGPSSKVEESPNAPTDLKTNEQTTSSGAKEDSAAAGTEEQSNRREAPILGDLYGAPIAAPTNSYLPSGSSNTNLPVPVYGIPDAPSNNIVYPAPPPDIPPPVSLPSISYGLPQLSTAYALPFSSSGLSLHTSNNLYGPPPKYSGSGGNRIKNAYGPPRFQYGPPGKPSHGSKFSFKFPYKSFGNYKKPSSTYGPPAGYLKDSYNSGKFSFNNYKILSHGGGSFNHHSHSGGSVSSQYGTPSLSTQYGAPSLSTQYGAPSLPTHYNVPSLSTQYGGPSISTQFGTQNLGIESHGITALTAPGPISPQYGVPDVGHSGVGVQTLSIQYGAPNDQYLDSPKPQYGPPQPSPHPRPPHPGAPAPPTPPDIKYDGWQPIPGLVSKIPTTFYGLPTGSQHVGVDLSYNKDLSPPPANNYIDVQTSSVSHGSVANLALENSHRTPQPGASDSYAAPLNTVTGSGGIVSSSGEEAEGKHHGHSQAQDVNIGLSTTGTAQDIQTLKSVEYQIFSGGAGGAGGGGGGHGYNAGGYSSSISDSYGAPPANSHSANGPYAAAHSYDKLKYSGPSGGKFSLGSSFNQNAFGSYNSHKSHGYKGLSLSNSGIGLIPPSGVYGVPPSGQYGTPLYSGHGSSLNALKINPPKHPVVHGQPIPPSIFESITKQTHSNGHGGYKGVSSYLPPPSSDLKRPSSSYGPASSTSLYNLPNSHTSISFQTLNHGSSDLDFSFGGASQSGLSSFGASQSSVSSYGPPLNAIDGSYSLPKGHSHSSSNDLVELDFTHPELTIDLTKGQTHAHANGQVLTDCSLKTQNLPSLSYGTPSGGGYSSALSGISSGLGGGHSSSSFSSAGASSYSEASLGHSSGSFNTGSVDISGSSGHSGLSGAVGISGPAYGVPESLPVPSAYAGYDVKPHSTYGVPDLDGSHSQKNTVVKVNAVTDESHGKSYGKHVAASFGPSSELIQSQSIDLNNIPLKGALGSYTLQIQSLDGRQNGISHGQVLNDGLLQSILAAIEQPKMGEKSQPIDLKQSLEKQNFVTNDTISSVVGKLADPEIRFSTDLVKEELDKTQDLADTDTQSSSVVRFVLPKTSANAQAVEAKEESEVKTEQIEDETFPLVEDNGIALYFSNKQRSKKDTEEKTNEKNFESHSSRK